MSKLRPTKQKLALTLAGLTTVVALLLIVERGGAIAWATGFFGALLFIKCWRKPAPKDLWLGLTLASVAVLAWIGVFYYVISTYESGEVVELVVDTSDGDLLAGKPLNFTRGEIVSQRLPKARLAESLPETEANALLEVMSEKYGDRMAASTIYYVMLASPRDRVSLVVDLDKR